jgi:hypothetical protein
MENIVPKHIMRFGIHSEKQFFLPPQFRGSYDAIALNGNLVAYSLQGVCSFLSGLLKEKPYFIDPITHAFGHHPQYISQQEKPGELVPKPAMRALAERYGEPATKFLGKRGLLPKDFDGDSARDFTVRVLDFQKLVIDSGLMQTGDAKYLDITTRTPRFLIAPYFYLGSNSVEMWLERNLGFVELAAECEPDLPIFAEILVAYDAFLDPDVRKLLVSKYGRCDAQGIILWVESFSEHSASVGALKGYRSLVEGLSAAGKEILVMYGGYFSIILRKHGVTAVCHGPGYGEEREVTPVGGGVPRPKFYFPSMHMRLPYREVAFALSGSDIGTAEGYYKLVCDCDMCHQILGDDLRKFSSYGEAKSGIRKDGIAFEYATTEARKITTAHYIYNKKKEFQFVDASSGPEIIDDLKISYTKCKELFGVSEAAHLEAWVSSIVN